MRLSFVRYWRTFWQRPASACRRLFKRAMPVTAGYAQQAKGSRSSVVAFAYDREAGTLMLDVLIGLLIGTVGLCLVLGGIALTTWRAGYAKQDTLKIIETRNERDKTNIFEITPDTFKKDEIKLEDLEKDDKDE